MTPDTTTELKPCPFCGGKAVFGVNEIDFVPWPYVRCDDCDAMLDAIEGDDHDAMAVRWNTRSLGEQPREPEGVYDPTTQPYDEPLRHVDQPTVDQLRRDLDQLRGMLEIERRINLEHASISILPLEWEEHKNPADEISYWADHQFGSYAIERDYFSVIPWELIAGGRVIGNFDTVEAAQVAAKENFERRLVSCFAKHPAHPRPAEQPLREALEFYRDNFKLHQKRTRMGVGLSEWKPTEALLEDCGERARAALQPAQSGEGK
ncbi:Lar family restriction alleviation protein [Bradyrhizobium genosp. L]|uniref:Lar family restriction alleviation protein n=1 Tax=Bradyrhizobium genosp. L TaxID=83637 RepID=UPI0018A28BB0|nr:Lar family restriction alleviation protein [Bradyrhizobium genosp. L]QPF81714.1 Lar family restriction alleviation protein [Bradyrhizobium genosp. L]QPF87066.1 Lar family restriction alleviation protein [Bradyrhizobium genosp. L]